MKFKDHKQRLMKDPAFREAYEELEPIHRVIQALVSFRIRKGITQEQLAEKIGTKQSSISRFEKSMALPSLSFLQAVAKALDLELRINVVAKEKSKTRKSKASELSDSVRITA